MDWIYLFLAGLLEIGWIISLKFTNGFTRPLPMACYALFGLGAAYFLSLSLRSIPIGLAYAIWVGVGIAGSNLVSLFWFSEPFPLTRLIFIMMILGGVAGLKYS